MKVGFNQVQNIYMNKSSVSKTFKQNNYTDTVSFSSNHSYSDINSLKHETARKFFSDLYSKSPEKCRILLNSDAIKKELNSDCGYFSDEFEIIHKEDIKALEKSIDKLSEDEIQNVIDTISDRMDYCEGSFILSGLALSASDDKALQYIVNSPKVYEDCIYSSGYSKDLCKYILKLSPHITNDITYNSVIEIEKAIGLPFDFGAYTSDSDSFKNGGEKAEEMSNYLSTTHVNGDFTAYRGEKSTWVFDSIPIDKTLEKEIRLLVLLNPKSRKDLAYPNNNKYSNYFEDRFDSVYKCISSKKNLSLADAMLAAKYLPQPLVDKILSQINKAKIQDTNFKSYTLDSEFAKRWVNKANQKSVTTIVTKTTIKEGSQGAYDMKSGQKEFILNNNAKIMTFNNAVYNKEEDRFYIDGEISSL